MRKLRSFLTVLVLFAMIAGFAPLAGAQEEMGVACDSTLVTLLLVAEHDYDYISGMMGTDMEMPALDLGQYGPVIDSIVAMMMEMQGEATGEPMDMTAHDAMLADMMAMDTAGMVAAYMSGMNMEMGEMTTLAPGNVADEDPICATVRADVEKFILAHILTEMAMMAEPM
jgi:hypothetical protein